MDEQMIKSYSVIMECPPSEVIFVGAHPLYRQGEEGEVVALIFAHKSDTPFGGAQSRHCMFIVQYPDGVQLFVPVAKYERYRVYFANDDLEGLTDDDAVVLAFPPRMAFFAHLDPDAQLSDTARAEVAALVYQKRTGHSPRAMFHIWYPDLGDMNDGALIAVSKHQEYRVWFD